MAGTMKQSPSFYFFCLVLTDSSCDVCTLLGARSAYSVFLLLAMFFLCSSYPTSADMWVAFALRDCG